MPINEHNTKPALKRSTLTSGEAIKLESLSFLLDIDYAQASNLSIIIFDDLENKFIFTVDNKNNKLIMDRTQYNHNPKEYEFGSKRSCSLTGKSNRLTLFCDQSIIEIFLDQGRNVFTSLFFPSKGNQYLKITLDEPAEIKATLQYVNKI